MVNIDAPRLRDAALLGLGFPRATAPTRHRFAASPPGERGLLPPNVR